MMQGEKNKIKIQLEKKASFSYLQMHLATFYLPIKILSTFYYFLQIFNNGKTVEWPFI